MDPKDFVVAFCLVCKLLKIRRTGFILSSRGFAAIDSGKYDAYTTPCALKIYKTLPAVVTA